MTDERSGRGKSGKKQGRRQDLTLNRETVSDLGGTRPDATDTLQPGDPTDTLDVGGTPDRASPGDRASP